MMKKVLSTILMTALCFFFTLSSAVSLNPAAVPTDSSQSQSVLSSLPVCSNGAIDFGRLFKLTLKGVSSSSSGTVFMFDAAELLLCNKLSFDQAASIYSSLSPDKKKSRLSLKDGIIEFEVLKDKVIL